MEIVFMVVLIVGALCGLLLLAAGALAVAFMLFALTRGETNYRRLRS